MRITMGMINQNYKNNLSSAKILLDKYQSRASTYRAFDKPSDDPLSASRSYDVLWEMNLNDDYNANLTNVQSSATTAESTLDTVVSVLKNTGSQDILGGINATMNQSSRDDIAGKLLTMRETLVSDMNIKYGNQYLFAGAGSGSAPFSVGDDGALLYRGINVNTGENTNGACAKVVSGTSTTQINFGKAIGAKLNGYSITVNADPGNASNAVAIDSSLKTIAITMKDASKKGDLQNLLQGAGGDNTFETALSGASLSFSAADLKGINISGLPDSSSDTLVTGSTTEKVTDIVDMNALANEKVFVDIGLGMKTDSNGNIAEQSAYNAALNGISFLGYGKDINGIDKNVYTLMGDIAAKLKDPGLKNQSLMDAVDPYITNFTQTQNGVISQRSQLGSKMVFLTATKTHLDNACDNLSEKESEIAYIPVEDAVQNLGWEQFCYDSALKVGAKILQPSLMDYMA